MKKVLFILFAVQFVLAPHITKSYSVNFIEDSYEYSIVNQEKKTVKKDILGNTIIEDDNGNKITIKKRYIRKFYYRRLLGRYYFSFCFSFRKKVSMNPNYSWIPFRSHG